MISHLQGTILERKHSSLLILVGGIGYEVLVPPALLTAMPTAVENTEVKLVIYYYLQIDQSRGVPVMIGFRQQLEREFFEQFIQVASIGPRTAVKAIVLPIAQIAAGIETGDMRILTSLPGVGRQKAKEIVAKLQGKMGAFCLIDGGAAPTAAAMQNNATQELESEVLAVLLQLGYKGNDAQQMLTRSLANVPAPTTTEQVLEIIYKQRG